MSDIQHPTTIPKVFISYSHDSPEHGERVLKLSDSLRSEGIDCKIDQYEPSPPEGWPRWMLNQFDDADYILIVCTEYYYRRFRGQEKPGTGKGVTWEGAIITNELYDSQPHISKFIPILSSSADGKFIPEPLRGGTYYVFSTEDGYEFLYRHLTNQPHVKKPELGKLKPLTSRKRAQDFSPASLVSQKSDGNQSPTGTKKKINIINQETHGNKSPAINANGDVNVTYRVGKEQFNQLLSELDNNKRVVSRLLKTLDEKEVDIAGRDEKIEQWVKKYNELKENLEKRSMAEPIIAKAKKALSKGDLETAEALLSQSLEKNLKVINEKKEAAASDAYELAGIKELQLKYGEALFL